MLRPDAHRCLILFATTSGSTRMVAEIVAEGLGRERTTILDIARLEQPPVLSGHALVVLATPTYGIGDCHSVWSSHGPWLMRGLPLGAAVSLICLADSRGHGASFAGGLARLEQIVAPRHPRLVGHVDAGAYTFAASPSVRDGRFPGFVAEFRRSRAATTARLLQWTGGIAADVGLASSALVGD